MASKEGPNWFVQRTLTAVSLGIAVHYNEILKAWQTCGSNSLCKTEKLVLYLTKIFGISSPSIFLSQLAKDAVNKLWERSKGEPLITAENASSWGSTFINLGIYGAVEYQLSFWWDWIRYATECLKLGVCENDNSLVWIHNMKTRYCNRTEVEDVYVELDCLEGDCLEIEDDKLVTKIDNNADWCVVFFNEMPLLASAVFIWTVYFISLKEVTTKEGNDKQQGNTKDDSKSTKPASDNKKRDTSKEGSSPTDKKKEKSSQDDASTQQVIVECPKCHGSRIDCIPCPLLIFCANCDSKIGSKRKTEDKKSLSSTMNQMQETNIPTDDDYDSDIDTDNIPSEQTCTVLTLDETGTRISYIGGLNSNGFKDCCSLETEEGNTDEYDKYDTCCCT